MVITDRFVYLHFGKTGGTFVEAVLDRLHEGRPGIYINTARAEDQALMGSVHQHENFKCVPEAFLHLPVLFSVRNPYDWYISFYEYGWWKENPDAPFDDARMAALYPSYPHLSFAELMGTFTDFRLDVLHAELRGRWSPDLYVKADIGYYTYAFIMMIYKRPVPVLRQGDLATRGDFDWGPMPETHFITTCNLNRGLHVFLASMGYPEEELAFILEMERVNPTAHRKASSRTWGDYFTPEMSAMIRRKDRLLFGLFPQFDPAPRAGARLDAPSAPTRRAAGRVSSLMPCAIRRRVASWF